MTRVNAARRWLTRIHRWTGLALVLFLMIVGFTGALLPFYGELQGWISPESVRRVEAPSTTAAPLDWLTLRDIALRRTGGVINEVPLHREPGEPAAFGVSALPGQPALSFDLIVLDPYSGEELSRENSANPPGGIRAQIMPFLYRLHTSLALGDWGAWILGVAALAWTIDCFVGFYLTLPLGKARWWRNWKRAWSLRLPFPNGYRLNFDLHRAAGLWLWPMLFVFAWSSVGMNLNSVYAPVMQFVFNEPPTAELPPAPKDRRSLLSTENLLRVARANVQAEARRRGYVVERERALWLSDKGQPHTYVVRTSRDKSANGANSYYTIDAHNGRILRADLPTGEQNGATVGYWLGLLHIAAVFGLPYRIFVSITGAIILLLSVTGVVIWMKKRTARISSKKRKLQSQMAPTERPVPAE